MPRGASSADVVVRDAMPTGIAATVGILHYTCPPIVGGVEQIMAQHARLLREAGMGVRILAGRGKRFRRDVPVELIPALDSKHPRLLAVNDELKRGEVTPRFDALADELTECLRGALAGLDACIVHNALSLHFNVPLTVALWRLAEAGSAPLLVAWCHDLSWTNPLYTPIMREGRPWSLLKTRLPGARYVVVSEDRRRELLELGAGGQPIPSSSRRAWTERPSSGCARRQWRWLASCGWTRRGRSCCCPLGSRSARTSSTPSGSPARCATSGTDRSY